MTTAPATWDEIVHHFLQYQGLLAHRENWGYRHHNVNDETYINGVPLIVDLDFECGYLLEIVDRTENTRSFGVIVTAPYGRGHDSRMYNEGPEFFDYSEAATWGTSIIFGLLEMMREAHRKTRS